MGIRVGPTENSVGRKGGPNRQRTIVERHNRSIDSEGGKGAPKKKKRTRKRPKPNHTAAGRVLLIIALWGIG